MKTGLKWNMKISSNLAENLLVEEEPMLSRLHPDDRLELEELFDGHLILGFFVRKPDLSHRERLFSLLTVLLFELMLEEMLFSTYRNNTIGEDIGAQGYFSNWISNDLSYAVLSVIAAIPIEAFMIASLSFKRKQASNWATASIVVGVLIILGSIIGIFFMNSQVNFEWDGLRTVRALIGILLEVGVVESFFMFARYFAIQSFGP